MAFCLFLAISLGMLISAKLFSLHSFMPGPQFGLASTNFNELVNSFGKIASYKMYFYFDFFFMASISWIAYIIFKALPSKPQIYPKRNILAILTIIFDVWEDFIYLGWFKNFKTVASLKTIFYSLFFAFLLYYIILSIGAKTWEKISQIIKSSFLSIIILLLIGLGLTFMPQGATLIVHLIDAPNGNNVVNLTITILLINMLAIIISHFPTYFDFAFNSKSGNENGNNVHWNLTNVCCGIGFILTINPIPRVY